MANGHGGKRPGAGRTKGSTTEYKLPKTKRVRVVETTSQELVDNLPTLQLILDYWEDECAANPEGARYYFLRQMIEEIRVLGY